MFSPKDSGLEFPLEFYSYRGSYFIRDAAGNSLFKMDVVKESLDDRERLEEWGQAICDKFNGAGEERRVVVGDGIEYKSRKGGAKKI